jgi:AcrR family transcriptional regulator
MSTTRVRPTRAETRSRLFNAAGEVFARVGVGAATVEQIASAAGFSRGAFYSNFASKDELLIAMLEDHLQQSVTHNLGMLAENPDPESFVAALAANLGREDDPLHHSPLLEIELILHVARKPEHRLALAERLRTMRSLAGEIAVSTLRAAGVERELDVERIGSLLVAIEDGLRLHRMLDPESTPSDAFLEAVRLLSELVVAPGSGGERSGG